MSYITRTLERQEAARRQDAIDDRDTRAVSAVNDAPCPRGECEYELAAHSGDRCPSEFEARAAYGDR